ncbi:MAG: prepilin-type N-terminal cleavage/methylation domain-containing protein [Myxococcales bacterium]|nr:prepilin-type N-terminal cleavage/methylation domain-containing protein [Myxococcales bacterium]MCB9704255.1 prepilin-type N-terminal cleavage/methylation domain-containing protein [Myxococcales bacterium]
MSARGSRGMTLIEVMIALLIVTMMVVAVWASFRGTLRGMRATEDLQSRYGMIRNAMGTMSREISMAYLSLNRPAGQDKHYTLFEGRDSFDADSLTFSSFAHLRIRKDADESDQSVIQYFLAKDPKDASRTHLYRRETRRLTGDRPEKLEDYFPAYVLCEDVKGFDVKYWDNRRIEWIDEWRTMMTDLQPDRLPERVKITMTIRDHTGKDVKYTTQVQLFLQESIDLSK